MLPKRSPSRWASSRHLVEGGKLCFGILGLRHVAAGILKIGMLELAVVSKCVLCHADGFEQFVEAG